MTLERVKKNGTVVEPAESGMVVLVVFALRLTVPSKLLMLWTVISEAPLDPLKIPISPGKTLTLKPGVPTLTVMLSECVTKVAPMVAVPVSVTV
jgi:hypothetical protein